MPTIEFRVDEQVLLPGFSAGLDERTALVRVSCAGVGEFDDAAARRVHDGALALVSGDPLYRVADADWPGAFLVDGDPPAASAPHRLGQWVVALTLAIQRWARDPVFRGRVLDADDTHLRLAIPWARRELFCEALNLALRLIAAWCEPNPGEADRLAGNLRDSLESLRAGGLQPSTFRLVQAAFERGIPVDIQPSWVLLGWGERAERMDGTSTGRTSRMGAAVAADEGLLGAALAEAGVPLPDSGTAAQDEALLLVADGAVMAAARAHRDGATDLTATVHPDNRRLAVRAARVIGLDIATVHMHADDPALSWRQTGASVAAVTAQPDLTPYQLADPSRDLHGEILDALFANRPMRIPTAAITGTNGKTTTAMMLHHIWTTAGALPGVTTTTQTCVGGEVLSTANLSGHPGARLILTDPAVQAAVVEVPRKGLKMFGHPCDRYDVAALLNVQDDHLGQYGIDTLEQMAELKSEVLQRASDAVVVNADDPLSLAMRTRAGTGRHVLVAGDAGNAAVVAHRGRGGPAVFPAQRDGVRWIVLADGADETPLMPVTEIPATMDGLLRVNETNAMFASAVAWAQGLEPDIIRAGLSTFANTRQQNPGRFNFLDGFPFTVLLDYAHNPDGVRGICEVAASLPTPGRRLLCAVSVGNRHVWHLGQTSPAMSAAFDEFIVSCDADYVLKYSAFGGDDPVATALAAKRDSLLSHGVDVARIRTEPDHTRAIRLALASAGPGDLVVILAEPAQGLPVIDAFARQREVSQ